MDLGPTRGETASTQLPSRHRHRMKQTGAVVLDTENILNNGEERLVERRVTYTLEHEGKFYIVENVQPGEREKGGGNLFMRPRIRRPKSSQSDFNDDPHREESRVTSRFRSGQNNGSGVLSCLLQRATGIHRRFEPKVFRHFDHLITHSSLTKDRVFAAH